MNTLEIHISNYLNFCKLQKCLDGKTIKAYKIDLAQFSDIIQNQNISNISTDSLESYIAFLHQTYKPKTAKRKIASVKAFYHYLEYKDIILINPFNKLQIKFREPLILPKTIPLHILEALLQVAYNEHASANTFYQRQKTLQDISILELLFSTGIRISELCSLKASDVNLLDNTILILGKGSKERRIQIGNEDVNKVLTEYQRCFYDNIKKTNYFFVKQTGQPVSDQSVRRMITKYATLADIERL